MNYPQQQATAAKVQTDLKSFVKRQHPHHGKYNNPGYTSVWVLNSIPHPANKS